MEIDSETIPSPPLAVQREIVIDPIDLVDSIALVGVPRYIAMDHKIPAWD
jgi:hypothetical protein